METTARTPRPGRWPEPTSATFDHVLTVFPGLGAMLRRPAGKLSGGERKVLAMGRVRMLRPKVFLLDSPAFVASFLGGHHDPVGSAG